MEAVKPVVPVQDMAKPVPIHYPMPLATETPPRIVPEVPGSQLQ